MKMKVHILSLIAATCLTVTTLGSYSTPSATVISSGAVTASKLDTKITEDLQEVLDESNDDDMIPVNIWINDIDYDTVERKTVQAIGFSKDTLMAKSNKMYEPLTASLAPDVMEEAVAQKSAVTMSSKDYETAAKVTQADTLSLIQDFYLEHKTELAELSDSVDMYVDTRRSYAREAYNEQNSDFVESYLKGAKIIFQSKYAPMIICELSKTAILNLDTLNNVESLSLYEELEMIDEGNIDVGVKSIRGDYTRDSTGLDGYGVKVGQIEDHCPETGIAELANTKITRNDENTTSDHASLVAAIIAGKTGMAPRAELYSTTKNDPYGDAEELIKSGVSVINMSAYQPESNTFYGNYAKWVDHIVYQHGVSWVKSAGNNGPDSYVTSPGNAYNVITVGGIDDKGTIATDDDIFCVDSCWKTGSQMPGKPDVVAPAEGFSVTGGSTRGGTSFAAAYVTGMIAQMMSFCPTLKLRPDAIKAAVVASCDRKTSGEDLSKITDKEGSGVVNAINAANSISNVLTQKTYYDTSDQTITFDFYPLTTGTKTIAIAWLKDTKGTGTKHLSIEDNPLVNFDLYVYDSNGQVVASSTSKYNSVEMVRFYASTTNKYTVKIQKVTSSTLAEKISLAHVRK